MNKMCVFFNHSRRAASLHHWSAMRYVSEKATLFQKKITNIRLNITENNDFRDDPPTEKINRRHPLGFKLLRQIFSILFLLSFMVPLQTLAGKIAINEEVFKQHGGDLNDIAGTIDYSNEPLIAKSYNKKYLSIGRINHCSAIWLGDEREQGRAYFLTSAHCIDYVDTTTEVNRTFRSWDGTVTATGQGFAYVPRDRVTSVKRSPLWKSSDIAILSLPTVKAIVDKDGAPLEIPILYDRYYREVGKTMSYVGYGIWGVGTDIRGEYTPQNKNIRRMWGQSIVESRSSNAELVSAYISTGSTNHWARGTSGDSGSAWWQEFKGKTVIVSVHRGVI